MQLTPSIAAGVQYQSNTFRAESEPTGSGNVVFTPALSLTAESPDHRLLANGSWTLRKYLTLAEPPAGVTTPGVGALDRFDRFTVGANADLFLRSNVGLRLGDTLARQYVTADVESAESPYITQTRNQASAAVRISPGSALEVVPSVQWTRDEYAFPRISDAVDPTSNVRNQLGPQIDTRWAFLPRTYLTGQLGTQLSSWQDNEIGSDDSTPLPNATLIRGQVGVGGQITGRLTAQAQLGYLAGLFADGSVDGPIGNADTNLGGLNGLTVGLQARYLVAKDTSQEAGGGSTGSFLTAGYSKDARLPYFTNYAATQTGYLDFTGRFGRLAPRLRYQLRSDAYRGSSERSDLLHVAQAGFGVYLASYALLEAGYQFQSRTSTVETVEFDNHTVDASFRFTY